MLSYLEPLFSKAEPRPLPRRPKRTTRRGPGRPASAGIPRQVLPRVSRVEVFLTSSYLYPMSDCLPSVNNRLRYTFAPACFSCVGVLLTWPGRGSGGPGLTHVSISTSSVDLFIIDFFLGLGLSVCLTHDSLLHASASSADFFGRPGGATLFFRDAGAPKTKLPGSAFGQVN